jgi:hypothetical protein
VSLVQRWAVYHEKAGGFKKHSPIQFVAGGCGLGGRRCWPNIGTSNFTELYKADLRYKKAHQMGFLV